MVVPSVIFSLLINPPFHAPVYFLPMLYISVHFFHDGILTIIVGKSVISLHAFPLFLHDFPFLLRLLLAGIEAADYGGIVFISFSTGFHFQPVLKDRFQLVVKRQHRYTEPAAKQGVGIL